MPAPPPSSGWAASRNRRPRTLRPGVGCARPRRRSARVPSSAAPASRSPRRRIGRRVRSRSKIRRRCARWRPLMRQRAPGLALSCQRLARLPRPPRRARPRSAWRARCRSRYRRRCAAGDSRKSAPADRRSPPAGAADMNRRAPRSPRTARRWPARGTMELPLSAFHGESNGRDLASHQRPAYPRG